MARRGKGVLDELATLPWPAGVVAGILGFLLVRYAIPGLIASSSSGLASAFSGAALVPLACAVLAACWVAAFVSFLRARRRSRLLDTRTGLESIAALGWRDFERLVGEAFRRQGYRVEETGLGGADGGIDLVLFRGGRRTLVQCKHWRREKVPVAVVREMYGLLTHHGADEVFVAAMGGFTPDAERFAAGKPIRLIEGATLLDMIRSVQRGQGGAAATPAAGRMQAPVEAAPGCPRCGAAMVRRTNRRDGSSFWGCSRFPSCRGARSALG